MKTKILLLILMLGLGLSCSDDSEDPVLSTATDIVSFSFTEATGAATISSSNHTIDVEVANDADLTDLSPTFSLSTGATSVPSSGSSGDYSSAFTINVTAEDGVTKQAWTVNVTQEGPGLSDGTDILTFSIPTETGAATIDASAHTIATEMPNGTDLATLIPEFTLSASATSAPESGAEGDYSSAVTITVTAEDGSTTQDWTVNVTEAAAALSDATDILTFSIPDKTGNATINDTDHTIAIEVANGTDLAKLTPEFTLSEGASSAPASGTEGDYSSEVTIAVTAEDGTTMQDWTVNVTEAAAGLSDATDILTFSIPDKTGEATINDTDHTIAIEMPNGTDLTKLTPEFTLSEGASSAPASGIEGDYSSAFKITVTAEDGATIQDWMVNVTAAAAGGPTTVEFADGGVKATAIRNLVVDGVTYDVEFKIRYPQQIYGDYDGTYTFTTSEDAITAIVAVNVELNKTDAAEVGEAGLTTDEGRYRIGYFSFIALTVQNTRFKSAIFEPASWREGLEETNLYNAEPVTFAVFTEL